MAAKSQRTRRSPDTPGKMAAEGNAPHSDPSENALGEAATGRLTLLYDADIVRRISAFRESKIAHLLLANAHEKLMQMVRHPDKGRVVLVYGPSGVGKSTLCTRVRDVLIQTVLEDLMDDPGRMPVVCLEVPNPSKGILKWDIVWKLALEVFDEILPDEKIFYPELGERLGDSGPAATERGSDPDILRHAVEQCIVHRRPLAMLYDEAHHFGKVGAGAQKLLNQMDTIKSLANCSTTPHVLFGTYELLNLRGLSGQLGRRAEQIHIPRYNRNHPAHETGFLSVLKKFDEQLKAFGGIDAKLAGLVDVLYDGSWGCVGTLKDWLVRAMRDALYAARSDDESVRKLSFADHVYNTVLPDAELIKLGNELIAGEERVNSAAKNPSHLQALQAKARSLPSQGVTSTLPWVQETGTEGDVAESAAEQDTPDNSPPAQVRQQGAHAGEQAGEEPTNKPRRRGPKGSEAGARGGTGSAAGLGDSSGNGGAAGNGNGNGSGSGSGNNSGSGNVSRGQRPKPGRRAPGRDSVGGLGVQYA
jgi:energy-coupling factor transporter ATP-binding protein EcfA2